MTVKYYVLIVVLFGLAQHPQGECLTSEIPDRLHASRLMFRHDAQNVRVGTKRYLILGLFPIHKKNCRDILKIKDYNGFQRAEAMIFALDFVNSFSKTLVQNPFALDGLLLDSCSHGIPAVEGVLNILRDPSYTNIAGLIGASYSDVSIQLSSTLQHFNLSMLSYASTSIELSKKQIHPLFARLVPSDDGQAQVVYELVVQLQWNTVAMIVSEGSDYSKSLKEKFVDIVEKNNHVITICDVIELKKNDSVGLKTAFRDIMTSKVEGVILFVPADFKKNITDVISEILTEQPRNGSNGSIDDFKIIATDAWDVGKLPNEETAKFLKQKSFVVIPHSFGFNRLHHGENITRHFENLDPASSKNPWIKEVWRSVFNCTGNQDDTRCWKKKINWKTFRLDSKVDFVVDAVMTYYDALSRCLQQNCEPRSDQFFRDIVLETNFSFRDHKECLIEFDKCGDRRGHYAIYRLTQSPVHDQIRYEKIGEWAEAFPEANKLRLNVAERDLPKPSHECQPKCDLSKRQVEEFHDKCCYECRPLLSPRAIRVSKGKFENCKLGWWPTRHGKTDNFSCRPLDKETLDSSNKWAIGAIFISVIGTLLGLAAFAFSIYYREHVVIRNSGRELSFFTWSGVMMTLFNTFFIFFSPPTPVSCGIIKYFTTLGYNFIVSSLFLKTRRLFSIFYAQFNANTNAIVRDNVKYTRPKYQVIFCLLLAFIQLIITSLWIYLDPPEVSLVYPEGRHVELCQLNPIHLMGAQTFNLLLCVVTTVYSFLTRKVPDNFNESKFINFAMYSICVAWIIEVIGWISRPEKNFIDLNDLTDMQIGQLHLYIDPERNWSVSALANSVSAICVLAILFFHRIYKILWGGDKKEESEPEIVRIANNNEM